MNRYSAKRLPADKVRYLIFPELMMLKTIKRLARRRKKPATETTGSDNGSTTAGSPAADGSAFQQIVQRVRPYTMTSVERIESLCNAVRHVSRAGIPGAIVECGVWRGGSMMAAALQMLEMNERSRDLFLYDTYEGMSEPTAHDVDVSGNDAAELMNGDETDREDPGSIWCVSKMDDVQNNLASTGYPLDRMHFVKGKVEETIPEICPQQISILRLDTDWYESTKHELIHLYPRLQPGGVLIIDDYGHWQGCRRAVDEYFQTSAAPVLLNRIDYTGRIAVKTV